MLEETDFRLCLKGHHAPQTKEELLAELKAELEKSNKESKNPLRGNEGGLFLKNHNLCQFKGGLTLKRNKPLNPKNLSIPVLH